MVEIPQGIRIPSTREWDIDLQAGNIPLLARRGILPA
jgi:hypothetical protein